MRVQLDPVVREMPRDVRITVMADGDTGVGVLVYAANDDPVAERCANTSAAINAALRPPQDPDDPQDAQDPEAQP